VRLYFNGVEDASMSVAPDRLIDFSITDLLIGAAFTGGGVIQNFAGRIDEVTIYNRALRPSEIRAIFLAGSAGKCKFVNDLVAFKPMPSTYRFTTDTTGCPAGCVGTFRFDARLTNISDHDLANLEGEIAEITDGNLLLTEDGVGLHIVLKREELFFS
jgi:hypothetical protein